MHRGQLHNGGTILSRTLAEDCNYSEKSGGSWNEESDDMGRAQDRTVGKGDLGKGNPVLLDPKYNGAQISREKLYQVEGEVHQEDRPDGDNKDRPGDGSENNVDEKKPCDHKNGKIETGEDDDIDSDGALGRDKNKLSGFKFLGSSTAEVRVDATLGMKLVDNSSFDENPGTFPDDKVILDVEKGSG